MKSAALALGTLLALASLHAQATCGPKRNKYTHAGKPVTITLHGPDRGAPVYYWHDRSTYALLYFRPEDLIEYLERQSAETKTKYPDYQSRGGADFPSLLDNIKADQPLKQTTDLFRYTLIDHRFDSLVNAVLSDLMKEGKVTLDRWIFQDQGKTQPQAGDDPNTIVMIPELGGDQQEAGRWFCTIQGDLLFKIGYVIYD